MNRRYRGFRIHVFRHPPRAWEATARDPLHDGQTLAVHGYPSRDVALAAIQAAVDGALEAESEAIGVAMREHAWTKKPKGSK